MDEKTKAGEHIATIKGTLTSLEAAIDASGDENLKDLVKAHHNALEAARTDYLAARQAEDAEGWSDAAATFSGGENKPDQPPITPGDDGNGG